MACPQDHQRYYTRPDADTALSKLIAIAKRSGRGGKSWKRLNVFPCGNHFHVGRANALPAKRMPTVPAETIPSTGDLRRKLERMSRTWERQEDHQRRERAAALGRLIAAEQAVLDAQNEYAEVARQVTAMFLPESR